ncbi:MAG: hypothetical protein J5493_00765 [Lachnospiraceae bacterium]|nr:hypothetical protein [Lachnospiraceae bacterium]
MTNCFAGIPAAAAEGSGPSGLTWLAVLAVIVFILICLFFPKKPHQPGNCSNQQGSIDRMP